MVAVDDLVPLDSVIRSCPEGQVVLPHFRARLDDRDWVTVTAILERSAVVEFDEGKRTVARFDRLLVDPGSVRTGPGFPAHLMRMEASRRGREQSWLSRCGGEI